MDNTGNPNPHHPVRHSPNPANIVKPAAPPEPAKAEAKKEPAKAEAKKEPAKAAAKPEPKAEEAPTGGDDGHEAGEHDADETP